MDFINGAVALHPELTDKLGELGELFTRKLWHQLTDALEAFLSDRSNARGNADGFLELYEQFLARFESKLNQIRLANLLQLIARSLSDPSQAIDFLQTRLQERTRLGSDASLCLELDTVLLRLQLGLLDEAKNGLDAAQETIDASPPSEAVVFSKLYKASAEYRKSAGPPEAYYANALMFLSYSSVEDLSEEERYSLATDMSLAAITGDGVYNFGEVIATPILAYLENTPNQWLRDLIFALHRGDIEAFNTVVDAFREQYFGQTALKSRHEFVKQKVVLLSLMTMVFERPAHERAVSFAAIAERTKLPLDQVEWVVMRAMSLGLIRGTMDQVDQVLSVTWVQPRVLDREQIAGMATRIDSWITRVREAQMYIQDSSPELVAAT